MQAAEYIWAGCKPKPPGDTSRQGHRAACNAPFEKSRNTVTTRINTGDFLCRLVTALRHGLLPAKPAERTQSAGTAPRLLLSVSVFYSVVKERSLASAWAKPQFAGQRTEPGTKQ